MKRILLIISILLITVSASGMMLIGGKPVANGLIGTSTHGSSGGLDLNKWHYSQWTPTTPGNVRYIHAYVSETDGGTSSICMAIWADNTGTPGTLLGSCSLTWEGGEVAAYQYCDTGSSFPLTGGVTYHIGLVETAGTAQFHYAAEGTAVDYDTGGYSACDTDNNLADDGDYGSVDVSIFVDNIDQAGP